MQSELLCYGLVTPFEYNSANAILDRSQGDCDSCVAKLGGDSKCDGDDAGCWRDEAIFVDLRILFAPFNQLVFDTEPPLLELHGAIALDARE